jgi:hypothetical protein
MRPRIRRPRRTDSGDVTGPHATYSGGEREKEAPEADQVTAQTQPSGPSAGLRADRPVVARHEVPLSPPSQLKATKELRVVHLSTDPDA